MLVFVSGFAECYKPITKNQLPTRIRTVAVPAFQNQALHYKIETRFTQAVINEIVRRGRGLRVQSEREGADAVIDGTIKSFNFGGVLLDERGRSRIYEVTITASVTVRDQVENRVIYDNQILIVGAMAVSPDTLPITATCRPVKSTGSWGQFPLW